MTVYSDDRRVVARGITFIDNNILLIERYRKTENGFLHYFTIPGGGVENNESFAETAVRETLEETNCNIKVIDYLGEEYYPNGLCHWFYCEYLDGNPTLGGEEKDRNNPNNSYKVVLIDMNDIDKINILGKGKEFIKQCYKKYKNTIN